MRFSKIWHWFVGVGIVILVIGIMIPFVQTNDTPVSEEANSSDNTDEINPPTKVDRQPKDSSPFGETGNVDLATKVKSQGVGTNTIPTELGVDSTAAVDIQRHFNELKSEYLDDRADYINMWLAAVAIVLTFFGAVIAVLGIVGYRRFRELEADAKKSVEKIEEHLAQSEAHLRQMSSVDFGDPEKTPEVEKVIRDVRSEPQSSFIDKVLTEIYALQRNGRVEDAVKKWRSIANIAEGTDSNLASRAWLSIAYLMPEGDDRLAAYDRAMDLNPYLTRDSKNQPISEYSKLFHDTIVVGAVLRYFNDSKFEKFSIAQEDIAERDYGVDVVLYDGEGQLAVIVECKINEDIARRSIIQFKEYFRRSDAQFGLLAAGTAISKWTFFRILGSEITEITRSQFETELVEFGSS